MTTVLLTTPSQTVTALITFGLVALLAVLLTIEKKGPRR